MNWKALLLIWNSPKKKDELLAFRSRQRNLPADNVTVSRFWDRQQWFDGALNNAQDLWDWRLFIDSSKASHRAVLLHNEKIKPSIPIDINVAHLRETYDNIKQLLWCINYDHHNQHNWQVCEDMKVVTLAMGFQNGYSEYYCVLCEWNSRARDSHYDVVTSSRETSHSIHRWSLGKKYIQHLSLVKSRLCYQPHTGK